VIAVAVVVIDFADWRPMRYVILRWVSVVLALAIWVALRAAVGIRNFDPPPHEALLSMLRIHPESIAIYSWRALVAPSLTISHPYASVGVFGITAGAAIFAALVASSVLWRRPVPLSCTTSQRHHVIALPVAIFLAGLVSSTVAITMFHEVSERYLYVPSIGLALLLGELVAIAMSARHQIIRVVVPAVIGVVVVLGLVQLEQCLPDWRNDDTL